MTTGHLAGILLVVFSSSWKFAATFPVAVYIVKMSFAETVLYTNIGGILGVFAFILLSKGILRLANLPLFQRFRNKKPKKKFTRRNRFIVKIKRKYGLAGIVVLTPLLLSIPVGTFLVARYYDRRKISYVYLIVGQIAWSLIYTFFYTQIKVMV